VSKFKPQGLLFDIDSEGDGYHIEMRMSDNEEEVYYRYVDISGSSKIKRASVELDQEGAPYFHDNLGTPSHQVRYLSSFKSALHITKKNI